MHVPSGAAARGRGAGPRQRGELAQIYARATLAFVGGTLAPIDGHDLLEPVFAGDRFLRPAHGDARQAAEILEASGAGSRVADAAELASAVVALLARPERRAPARRGRAASAGVAPRQRASAPRA